MNIIFFIANTSRSNRKQAYTLATEQVKAGYNVKIIDTATVGQSIETQNGARIVKIPKWASHKVMLGIWSIAFFALHKRAIVHMFGLRATWLNPVIRIMHPMAKIVAHVDDTLKITGGKKSMTYKILSRLAHVKVVTRANEEVEAVVGQVKYMSYPMHVKSEVVDPSIMQVHGLTLQKYVIGYADPEKWEDIESLVNDWRKHLKKEMLDMKLAVIFTKNKESKHIAFGSDVVILGHVTPFVDRILASGARAVLTPKMNGYRFEIIQGMSFGKLAVPIRELVDQNPFAISELAEMYQQEGHCVDDLFDPAIAAGWGHMARAIVKEKNEPSEVAHQYEDLYEDLLYADAAVARIRI